MYIKTYINVIPGIDVLRIERDDSIRDGLTPCIANDTVSGKEHINSSYDLSTFMSWMNNRKHGNLVDEYSFLDFVMNSDDAAQVVEYLKEMYGD